MHRYLDIVFYIVFVTDLIICPFVAFKVRSLQSEGGRIAFACGRLGQGGRVVGLSLLHVGVSGTVADPTRCLFLCAWAAVALPRTFLFTCMACKQDDQGTWIYELQKTSLHYLQSW